MLNGKHGWFTQYEEAILVNRILRDDSTKGDMNNRQHALKDVDLWPIYVVCLFHRSRITCGCN